MMNKTTIMATGIVSSMITVPKHPLETVRPIFCCLPLFVKGTPIFLEMFDLVPEIPVALFQEKPPLFIIISV